MPRTHRGASRSILLAFVAAVGCSHALPTPPLAEHPARAYRSVPFRPPPARAEFVPRMRGVDRRRMAVAPDPLDLGLRTLGAAATGRFEGAYELCVDLGALARPMQ